MTAKFLSLTLRMLSAVAFTATFGAFAVPAEADPAFTTRSGGASAGDMVGKSGASPASGLAFVRPVLTGVLYRAGFKGGDKGHTGLSQSQREDLCDEGFSSARYIDFGKNTDFGTTKCGKGKMSYAPGASTKPHDVMVQLYDIIKNPGQGPMLVHCMWGVHSSGAISAMALVQFCGWSEERAKAYWDKARNGADCSGGCDTWIDKHFATFKFDAALVPTAAEQSAICPK